MDVRREDNGRSWEQAVETLIERLHLCQRALGPKYMGSQHLVSAIVRACQTSPDMVEALSEPSTSFVLG